MTVYGRDAVVVITAEEFRSFTGGLTGQGLIDACQASLHREISVEPVRQAMPVRGDV